LGAGALLLLGVIAGCGSRDRSGIETRQGQATVTPTFVQGSAATPSTPQTSVAVPITGAQAAGDLNVVFVGWADATTHTIGVTDARGNAYQLAVGPTLRSNSSGAAAQSVYYAKNIGAAGAGTNSVTVAFSPAAQFADIRVLEYAGLDPANPVDVSVASSGTNATSTSGSITTTNATDLLVAGNELVTSTKAAGSGYTSRILSPDGDIAEDRVVTAPGS